jgi:2-polyprenyl-3-methyl-5-hydroxy-6-metoxy-1,4-benzoquinol methylase
MQIEKQRYERERNFHNWVFSEKGRTSVGKFYSVADMSPMYYRERILASGGHDILEIGCGPGSVALFLGRDVSFTAIDISDVAVRATLEEARTNAVAGSYLPMNAEETAFADHSFDLICGTGILHHLNLKRACAEIHRILRPGQHGFHRTPGTQRVDQPVSKADSASPEHRRASIVN